MSSRSTDTTARICAVLLACAICEHVAAQSPSLRVCADPDNLPYSDAARNGFEDRVAAVVADALGIRLEHVWVPLKRGFVRKTLGANECDVLIGVPVDFERVLTTRAYYRSSYVFVQRVADASRVRSFLDPQLKRLRIGVQLVGDDLDATPAGHALAHYGAVDNVTGFTVYGDGPAARRIIDALVARRLDMAVVWGPQAGYFAHRADMALEVTLARLPEHATLPRLEFAIAMGVRRSDRALRERLDDALVQRRADIDRILAQFSVPRIDRAPEQWQ